MNKSILALLAFCLALPATKALAGDTGTYEILDYRVNLTPRADGTVDIDYYQKWAVTGGHIPWITVGLPNSDYEIKKSSGNAASIKPANSGGWSGVRLDLDRDYQPDETFEVNFSIVQTKLFWADEEKYYLAYTPGWYDQAPVHNLDVTVRFFAKLESVTAEPEPSKNGDETLSWQTSLGKGQKFSFEISFPKAVFEQPISEENLKDTGGVGWLIILIIFILLVVVIIFLAASGVFGGGGFGGGDDDDGYSGGSIFYGGGSGGGSGGGGRSAGGGGGFGGRTSSCACACVSCACACACAGGGGAGCDRKAKHLCPVCNQTRAES